VLALWNENCKYFAWFFDYLSDAGRLVVGLCLKFLPLKGGGK